MVPPILARTDATRSTARADRAGWAGLRLLASAQDAVDDAAVHVYLPGVVLDMTEETVGRQLVLAEATFVLGTGRDLAAWLARLPERID